MPVDRQDSSSDIAAGFRSGKLDRRVALKRLFGIGIRAPAAYMLLGLLPEETVSVAHAQVQVDAKQLGSKLFEIVSHPRVLGALGDKTKTGEERAASALREVRTLFEASPDFGAGKKREFRVAMRIFESEYLAGGLSNKYLVQGLLDQSAFIPSKGPIPMTGPSNQRPFNAKSTVCLSFGVGLCVSSGTDGE